LFLTLLSSVSVPVRNFNAFGSRIKDGETVNGFRTKTLKDVWCGDTGAYPVMGVIAFACAFCAVYGGWFMAKSPDVRLAKRDRKAPMRGEFVDEK
jgi:hypothetical protein